MSVRKQHRSRAGVGALALQPLTSSELLPVHSPALPHAAHEVSLSLQ